MENNRENIMGTKPVNSLLVGMAVPIMLSMLVQALYNIVDSVFVSMLSENALTSVSLIFPIQNLMISVAVGTALGVNAVLSRRLGEKDFAAANRVADNGIFLALLSAIAFAILGLMCSKLFMSSFTSDPEILSMGADYMAIVTIFSLGIFMQCMLERIIQVTGKTFYQMVIQLVGAVVNIILDPILIFGLCGLPKMGVAGAAIATVLGQTVSMIIGFYLNATKNHEVKITFKGFRPCARTIKNIYQIGVPSIIMQSIGSVMTFGINKILIVFSSTAVSVFGIYFKLQSFVFMPVFGVTSALVPIVGYNYGAQRPKRILQAVRMALIMCVGIMTIGLIMFEVAPELLLSMFNASPSMLEIGVPALRIIAISFVFAGASIVASSMFQALGEGMHSLIMSVVRQLVVLLPAAYIWAKLFGLSAVWWSFPTAEIAAFMLTIVFSFKTYRTILKPMMDKEMK